MEITFNNHFGTIKLEGKLRSIFDNQVAGQTDINGDYYCIYADYKTKQFYALTRETGLALFTIGYPLEEGETATFNGENVRGMTFREECLYNEDRLIADVDLWGNIRR